mgnify:CR=1 FL=1
MVKICVKSGIKQLPWFANEKFPYFEAFLDHADKPDELLNTRMKLISIHLPNVLRVDGEIMPVSFNPASPAAETSKRKLEEIVEFSKKNGVENIVLHPGHFNSFSEDRYSIIDDMAKYFSSLSTSGVKICVENIPCWMNISFENEPLCSNEKHLLYLQKQCPNVGLAFDIDHAAINAVFQEVYQKYRDSYRQIIDKTKLLKEMEREIIKLVSDNIEYFVILVNKTINEFLQVIEPTVVHATGSDFCQYWTFDDLPLCGESLPMGFLGKISGQEVRDRLDHSRWIEQLIEKDINVAITMELSLRGEYDYIEQLKTNQNYLNTIINTKIKKHVDN